MFYVYAMSVIIITWLGCSARPSEFTSYKGLLLPLSDGEELLTLNRIHHLPLKERTLMTHPLDRKEIAWMLLLSLQFVERLSSSL